MNGEITLHEFPAKYLFALEPFAANPKTNFRYYLATVAIQPANARIVATDGHRLLALPLDPGTQCSGDKPLLIPIDAIAGLRKRLKAKERREALVSVQDMGSDALPRYRLVCAGEYEVFQAVEGKYPDIDRIIPDRADCNGSMPSNYTFNWSYVESFQNAAGILTNSRTPSPVVLMPNKNSSGAARLDMIKFPNALAVVMPMRR